MSLFTFFKIVGARYLAQLSFYSRGLTDLRKVQLNYQPQPLVARYFMIFSLVENQPDHFSGRFQRRDINIHCSPQAPKSSKQTRPRDQFSRSSYYLLISNKRWKKEKKKEYRRKIKKTWKNKTKRSFFHFFLFVFTFFFVQVHSVHQQFTLEIYRFGLVPGYSRSCILCLLLFTSACMRSLIIRYNRVLGEEGRDTDYKF